MKGGSTKFIQFIPQHDSSEGLGRLDFLAGGLWEKKCEKQIQHSGIRSNWRKTTTNFTWAVAFWGVVAPRKTLGGPDLRFCVVPFSSGRPFISKKNADLTWKSPIWNPTFLCFFGSPILLSQNSRRHKNVRQFDHPQAHKDLLELQKGRAPPVKKWGIFVSVSKLWLVRSQSMLQVAPIIGFRSPQFGSNQKWSTNIPAVHITLWAKDGYRFHLLATSDAVSSPPGWNMFRSGNPNLNLYGGHGIPASWGPEG